MEPERRVNTITVKFDKKEYFWEKNAKIIIKAIRRLIKNININEKDVIVCGFGKSNQARLTGTTFGFDIQSILQEDYGISTETPLFYAFELISDSKPRLALYDKKQLKNTNTPDEYQILFNTALIGIIEIKI